MRIEKINGRRLLCGFMLPRNEVVPGQIWAPADGSKTVVVITDASGEIHYQGEGIVSVSSSQQQPHSKDNFDFQTRYCLDIDGPNVPKYIVDYFSPKVYLDLPESKVENMIMKVKGSDNKLYIRELYDRKVVWKILPNRDIKRLQTWVSIGKRDDVATIIEVLGDDVHFYSDRCTRSVLGCSAFQSKYCLDVNSDNIPAYLKTQIEEIMKQPTVTVTRTIHVKKTITVNLNNDVLLAGIKSVLGLVKGDKIVSMQFKIPGGGDYSNMSVDVDTLQLVVTVESTTED